LQHAGETIKDTAISAKDSIADTTRRAGESIKETAISAKDALADTSRKAVDVGERVKDSVFPRKGI
jgi:hypothetical protein